MKTRNRQTQSLKPWPKFKARVVNQYKAFIYIGPLTLELNLQHSQGSEYCVYFTGRFDTGPTVITFFYFPTLMPKAKQSPISLYVKELGSVRYLSFIALIKKKLTQNYADC